MKKNLEARKTGRRKDSISCFESLAVASHPSPPAFLIPLPFSWFPGFQIDPFSYAR
ncbi:MAG: hypothetical protein ABI540_00740 [Spartobacteria bacterium]